MSQQKCTLFFLTLYFVWCVNVRIPRRITGAGLSALVACNSLVLLRDVSVYGANDRISPRDRRVRRKKGIRKDIEGSEDRPRLSVFRSNNHIYGQLIDDDKQHTLAAAGTVEPELKAELEGKTPVEQAAVIGRKVAERAKEKGIEKVVFDRNGYKYHGRVAAVAEGAREGGLVF